jgi:hypothetical protein
MNFRVNFQIASMSMMLLQVEAVTSGLRQSALALVPASRVADTVRALDKNGNGKVDTDEIMEYAKTQGLDTTAVINDFHELDTNKDGELDAVEISGLLNSDESQATPEANSVIGAASELPKATVTSVASTIDSAPVASTIVQRREANPQTLDVLALEQDAKKHAANVVASGLAQRAQTLLSQSAEDTRKAAAFEQQARTLREQATSLIQQADAQTREAAGIATKSMTQKSVEAVNALKTKVQESTAAADEHRNRAKQAMQHVREAWTSLRQSRI